MKKNVPLTHGGSCDIYVVDEEKLFEKTMFYYHGGGLIYGTRSDLPNRLKEMFLAEGYTIVAMDYPLAPNFTLAKIIEVVQENFDSFRERYLCARPFLLAGRSAGSFVCFQLAKYLLQQPNSSFRGLINFYGYTDLDFIFNANQQIELSIPPKALKSIDLAQAVYDDPNLSRSLLYFDAIQKGKLAELYAVTKESARGFTLSEAELRQLPRSFHAASVADDEVPFSYSKRIKRLNSEAAFVPVYDLAHDFLKLTNDPQVDKVYQKLAEWLTNINC